MKLVSYLNKTTEKIGLFINGHIYDLLSCASKLSVPQVPGNMTEFLQAGEGAMKTARIIQDDILIGNTKLQPVDLTYTQQFSFLL